MDSITKLMACFQDGPRFGPLVSTLWVSLYDIATRTCSGRKSKANDTETSRLTWLKVKSATHSVLPPKVYRVQLFLRYGPVSQRSPCSAFTTPPKIACPQLGVFFSCRKEYALDRTCDSQLCTCMYAQHA